MVDLLVTIIIFLHLLFLWKFSLWIGVTVLPLSFFFSWESFVCRLVNNLSNSTLLSNVSCLSLKEFCPGLSSLLKLLFSFKSPEKPPIIVSETSIFSTKLSLWHNSNSEDEFLLSLTLKNAEALKINLNITLLTH